MKRERKLLKLASTVACLTLGAAFTLSAHAGATLDNVKKKGFVQCGISDGLPGFSYADAKGEFRGFDVDVCRAVAAAVFGDAQKVKYTQLTAKERFTALQSGEVDMLSRSTTWTSSRDGAMGIQFTNVAYYDGQGFLVNKKLGVKSAKELDGATFCIQAGTVTELNLSDYARSNNIKYTPITFDTSDESFKALESGRCDVLTTDQSQLYGQRLKLATPDDFVVLPDVISKEPLSPAVRRGDEDWFTVVRWSLSAMLNAEELGITSRNVAELIKSSKNPDIARLLGTEGALGKDLNLPDDWASRIIAQVGNYGESFDRNLGAGSDMKIKRGLNALWNQGGLQYGPPVR
ncbi:amino acid ABC transporter substrate-binding protein [Pseudomonas sp. CDFA 602]|uniref:amino acid ABC transporter substrate-binding protein n=1 Tax=Pseudomonas californiensis TaxID=2829823 RepID=UPI001E2BD660|nr:amino acid ABC transporter substrate-binding protein [Pseudomonas californiensis]MCD5996160.1 amino acid ABC transporter substrate-binding protein [Pseudomonas californiensis]MCD6001792.1 amino acid ABC transporter substrate-binding protein [Pseudomonas californiensis]